MEHFVRVIFDHKEQFREQLDESVFPRQNILETVDGRPVIEIPLERSLSESESEEYAERLANYMFDQGYDDFDIEISTDDFNEDEETYDGDNFYEEYGELWYNEDEELDEAEYQGRKVKLGKPMRGDVKKFKVYVRKPNGKVVKVNFGDPNMKIKKSNPARRRSFRARHNCDNPGPRHKARFWSCKKW